jgi:hypothetical protein
MEKTLQFAIEEARQEGFESGINYSSFKGEQRESWDAGKAIAVAINQLREQIAQEIETHIDSDSEARAFTLAANIARGQSSCFRFGDE